MKNIFVFVFILIIFTACGAISEKDLMGGEWVGTAGYENGEIKGESSCSPFEHGVRFIDEENAISFDEREYFYDLINREEGFLLIFIKINPDIHHGGANYVGEMVSNDEMVWESRRSPEKYNCYLERSSKKG